MDPEAYNRLLEQAQGGDALSAIALELSAISTHLKYLGVGDAATTMGAIEALAVMTKAGLQEVGEGLDAVATAIREAAEDREQCPVGEVSLTDRAWFAAHPTRRFHLRSTIPNEVPVPPDEPCQLGPWPGPEHTLVERRSACGRVRRRVFLFRVPPRLQHDTESCCEELAFCCEQLTLDHVPSRFLWPGVVDVGPDMPWHLPPHESRFCELCEEPLEHEDERCLGFCRDCGEVADPDDIYPRERERDR